VDRGFAFGINTGGTATLGAGLAAANGGELAMTIKLGMYSAESGNGSRGASVMPKPMPK
jgi:hypothetical protein